MVMLCNDSVDGGNGVVDNEKQGADRVARPLGLAVPCGFLLDDDDDDDIYVGQLWWWYHHCWYGTIPYRYHHTIRVRQCTPRDVPLVGRLT